MAGAIRLGELCHIMESRIEAAFEANAFPPALFEELRGEDGPALASTSSACGARPAARRSRRRRPVAAPAEAGAQAAAASRAPSRRCRAAAAMLRVNADTLDHLINESGEVAIARSRIEAELRAVKQSLSDLSESVARLRGQLREVEVQADSQMQSRLSVIDEDKSKAEYDPLEFDRYTRLQELTRLMAESLNDVVSIQQSLLKNVGETDAALLQQARISRERAAGADAHARGAVRQPERAPVTASCARPRASSTRRPSSTIEGAEVELDRSVLERIGAPLEHMLRNALAHGIEAPAARAAAGKPESGRISSRCARKRTRWC